MLHKKDQSINCIENFHAEGGHPPPTQRRRYANCNARILAIVDDYPNRDHTYYLRGISHNFYLYCCFFRSNSFFRRIIIYSKYFCFLANISDKLNFTNLEIFQANILNWMFSRGTKVEHWLKMGERHQLSERKIIKLWVLLSLT